jgi:hypothetical protein
MKFEPSEVVGTKLLAAFVRADLTVLVGFMALLGLMVFLPEAPEKALAMAGDGGFQGFGGNDLVGFTEVEERFEGDAFRLGIPVLSAFFQPEPALPVGFDERRTESGIDEPCGWGIGRSTYGKGDFRGIS